MINSALKEAMEAASQLPDEEQKRIAAIILEEMADEAAWDRAFANSQPQLERLADEADEDYRAGRTDPLDPETL